MNRRVIDYLERRMRVSRDNARGGDRRDYEHGGDRRDYDYDRDERRGVKGTGPYGIGGRRYPGRDRSDYDYDRDRRDYDMNMSRSYGGRDYERGGRDYRDGDRDYARGGDYRRGDYDYDDRDYNMHQEMKLTSDDMHRWKQKLRNEDGTKGEHYDMQQIMHAVDKLGIKMNGFDEKDLCMVVNMLYSDYCKVVKKYLPVEKELMFYVDLARAFLEDADGPKPAEKLALYYYCIVDNDEV